jgi:hypothetical protein
MKVVINSCFGGFSLSNQAIAHYLKLCGDNCFFYEQTAYSFREGSDLYEKKELSDIKSTFSVYTSTKDLGASFETWPRDNDGYFYDRDIQRNDPLLIKTIEDIGEKEASGRCASLTIVEIPDDADWEISEYDGNEHVAEKHRTWG